MKRVFLLVLLLLLVTTQTAQAATFRCQASAPFLYQTIVTVTAADGGFGQRLVTTNWQGYFSTAVYVGGHGWVAAWGYAMPSYQGCSAG